MALTRIVTKEQWLELVEAVAAGRLSMTDVIHNNQPEPGDYFGHVQCARAFFMLMSDTRILKRMSADLTDLVKEKTGRSGDDLTRAMSSKDGLRRFTKMGGFRKEMAETSPALLTGTTFDECLQQYLKIMGHLEGLWTDSRDLFRREHYPLATFTAILLLEEMGKIGMLWHELLAYDMPRSTVRDLTGIGRNHRQKAFIAVVAGGVINTRLDRVLGLKSVRRVLQDAESGKLETIRQACLYIDTVDGAVATPGERISREQAEFFVVLAGEIWAEVYGHLPFEFERMIDLVSSFEAELGYSHERIHGRPEGAGNGDPEAEKSTVAQG